MPDNSSVLSNSQGTTDLFGTMKQEQDTPPVEISSTNKSGSLMHTLTLDDATLQQFLKMQQYTSQAMASMQEEVTRLKQQEDQARKHPLLNVLSNVAGELAVGDKRLPPAVAALGRANLALNPTPDTLGKRRLELSEQMGRTAALGGEAALRGAQYRLDVTRENRLERRTEAEAAEKLKSDNAKIFRDLGTAAQKGELTDAKITSKVLTDTGVKPDVAKSQADQLVAISQAKRELDAAAAATKDAREERTLRERAREADQHMATILAAANLHTDTQMKMAELKAQEAEKKATAKTEAERKKIPATLPDKLSKLSAAEKALDEVEAGLKKYSAYQGVVAGRLVEPVAAYVKQDVAKFFTKMRLQVAQAIKSTEAGARGFGPMERGFFEQLAESKNHSATQNLGVIDAWRDYLRQNRSAYFDVYEGLHDERWRKTFGKDAAQLFESVGVESTGDPVEDVLKKYAKPK